MCARSDLHDPGHPRPLIPYQLREGPDSGGYMIADDDTKLDHSELEPMPKKMQQRTGYAGGCQTTQEAAGGREGTRRGLPHGPYELFQS
jgi:hypothetical protein